MDRLREHTADFQYGFITAYARARLLKLCVPNDSLCVVIGGQDSQFSQHAAEVLSYLVVGGTGVRDVLRFDSKLADLEISSYPSEWHPALEELVVYITKEYGAGLLMATSNEVTTWRPARSVCAALAFSDITDETKVQNNSEVVEMYKVLHVVDNLQRHANVCFPMGASTSPKVVEEWPLVQAFGLEGIGPGGFLTQKHKVFDIWSSDNTREGAMHTMLDVLRYVDAHAVGCILSSGFLSVLSQWSDVQTALRNRNTNLHVTPQKHLENIVEELRETLAAAYEHGCLRRGNLVGNEASHSLLPRGSGITLKTSANGKPSLVVRLDDGMYGVRVVRTVLTQPEGSSSGDDSYEAIASVYRHILQQLPQLVASEIHSGATQNCLCNRVAAHIGSIVVKQMGEEIGKGVTVTFALLDSSGYCTEKTTTSASHVTEDSSSKASTGASKLPARYFYVGLVCMIAGGVAVELADTCVIIASSSASLLPTSLNTSSLIPFYATLQRQLWALPIQELVDQIARMEYDPESSTTRDTAPPTSEAKSPLEMLIGGNVLSWERPFSVGTSVSMLAPGGAWRRNKGWLAHAVEGIYFVSESMELLLLAFDRSAGDTGSGTSTCIIETCHVGHVDDFAPPPQSRSLRSDQLAECWPVPDISLFDTARDVAFCQLADGSLLSFTIPNSGLIRTHVLRSLSNKPRHRPSTLTALEQNQLFGAHDALFASDMFRRTSLEIIDCAIDADVMSSNDSWEMLGTTSRDCIVFVDIAANLSIAVAAEVARQASHKEKYQVIAGSIQHIDSDAYPLICLHSDNQLHTRFNSLQLHGLRPSKVVICIPSQFVELLRVNPELRPLIAGLLHPAQKLAMVIVRPPSKGRATNAEQFDEFKNFAHNTGVETMIDAQLRHPDSLQQGFVCEMISGVPVLPIGLEYTDVAKIIAAPSPRLNRTVVLDVIASQQQLMLPPVMKREALSFLLSLTERPLSRCASLRKAVDDEHVGQYWAVHAVTRVAEALPAYDGYRLLLQFGSEVFTYPVTSGIQVPSTLTVSCGTSGCVVIEKLSHDLGTFAATKPTHFQPLTTSVLPADVLQSVASFHKQDRVPAAFQFDGARFITAEFEVHYEHPGAACIAAEHVEMYNAAIQLANAAIEYATTSMADPTFTVVWPSPALFARYRGKVDNLNVAGGALESKDEDIVIGSGSGSRIETVLSPLHSFEELPLPVSMRIGLRLHDGHQIAHVPWWNVENVLSAWLHQVATALHLPAPAP